MKTKQIQDERILQGKRKINSSAFGLVFIGLWLILLYRQFILHQEAAEYLDIFLLTIGISIYITVNNVMQGYYITYRKKKTGTSIMFVGALVGTIVFTVIQAIVMKVEFTGSDLFQLLLGAVIFFVTWLGVQFFLLSASEKQANKDID